MSKKRLRTLTTIPLVIIIVIIILLGIYFTGNYQMNRVCQDEFAKMQISILSELDSLKEQTGLEYARTISVVRTSYMGDVKTPEEIHAFFCDAWVLMCRKENGEIQYCQQYVIPFTAPV